MITLVGKALAKEGLIFYSYKNTKCIGCRYYRVCMNNMEDGRRYIITKVMDHVLPCKLHEEGEATVVEIEEADYSVLIPSKNAPVGAIITYDPHVCKFFQCPHRKYCFVDGLIPGDKCTIIEIGETITDCQKKEPRTRVKMKRITKEE